jgi:mersacidin/lichenicidin family type 2 lantibiotic
MSQSEIVRAWKDVEYRLSLSAAERSQLPPNPAGSVQCVPGPVGDPVTMWPTSTYDVALTGPEICG